MTTEELRKKVEAAEQKVEKCRATIVRHKQQMEKKAKQLRSMGVDPERANRTDYAAAGLTDIYSLLYDYHVKQDDIKGATNKLADAERICQNWKTRLDLKLNEEKVIANDVPQIIKDFLQAWKEKTFDWYVRRHQTYVNTKADFRKRQHAARVDALKTLPEYASLRERVGPQLYNGDYYTLNPWPRQPMENYLKAQCLDDKTVKEHLAFIGDGIVSKMCDFRKEDERLAWLDKTLEEEKQRKMLDLVGRVTKITGPITDMDRLYISHGDINGIVVGEKGAAKVQTISAGGYNIQCFHFRCLVDDVSKKFMETPKPEKVSLDIRIQKAASKTSGTKDSADIKKNEHPR